MPANLGAIQQPTLIIWGEDDPVFPVGEGHTLGQLLPNATLHTLPGVGHIPHEEAGAEVERLLVGWVTT